MKTSASFDDPNLVSRAGLVPVMSLAGRAGLVARAPLLPGAGVLAFAGIDSMQKRACGHKKQGARFGPTKISGKTVLVRGLNALAATVCTPQSAPVISATRLRGGGQSSDPAIRPIGAN